MNTFTDECVGKKVIFKDTKEKGIIIFFEYIPDLNHYHFKIETKKEIINCFNENEFIFI